MTAPTTTSPAASTSTETSPAHQPYVPDNVQMPEFTWPAVLVGAVLGIIFGASSLYLVLKVGMTVSASIPVAVLSITLFRVFSKLPGIRRATILENNIVQTTGSAGESIAFGVGVTMPALMLLGFEMDIGRVMVVSILGGLLGILMMIPLRRAFIVKKHGELKYPEGTACADVLIVGEQGGSSAKTVFVGFGIAFVYQFLWQGLKLWKEVIDKPIRFFKNANPALEVNPALLGVGYIIGTKISCIMVAGGVLASFVLIPAIRLFGDALEDPLYPGTTPIGQMDEETIWKSYVLYIGAGAVAAGGIISLFQALPLIFGSIKAGLQDMGLFRKEGEDQEKSVARTDRDMPMWVVGVGSLFLVLAIWSTSYLHHVIPGVPDLNMNLLGALLIVLFGFLFVTVSSRLTGEIGSSSNPISGMTVATLLLTCLIFFFLGWTNPEDRLTALSVAAVVCIAASNGGTTSQDLKTGYLVGGTPKWQQWAILVGSLSSALVIGYILVVLNAASTVVTTKNLPVLSEPLDASKLHDTMTGPDGVAYHVWRPTEGNLQEVPPGEYLVNDQGYVKYLRDPGINGNVSRRDDGTEVQKFKAPKARLMSLITDGILTQKLPWTLVLLGVSIAVVLELCGVPSLPFAVGVYLPLSSSTPIFVGGLARFVADRWGRKPEGATPSETEADMSPGVLLSTGYIAGGSIAGVLIAFLSFSDTIPAMLSAYQFRPYSITKENGLEDAVKELAQEELGFRDGKVPEEEEAEVDKKADEAIDLNGELVIQYLKIPGGTVLKLPREQTYRVKADASLGDIARAAVGSRGKAQLLFDLNVDHLIQVPAKTMLKLPQHVTEEVLKDTTLGDLAKTLLGKPAKAQQLWDLNKAILARVAAGTVLLLPEEKTYTVKENTLLKDIAKETLGSTDKARTILALNQKQLGKLLVKSPEAVVKVPVPAGTVLRLPQRKTFEVPKDASLGEIAKEALGNVDKAQPLWELNKDELMPPVKLPAGSQLKVPQGTGPAVYAFGVLVALLILVGMGLLLRSPPISGPALPPGSEPTANGPGNPAAV